MAYKVIILYRLYMPPYFLGTFTEYPSCNSAKGTYIPLYVFPQLRYIIPVLHHLQ